MWHMSARKYEKIVIKKQEKGWLPGALYICVRERIIGKRANVRETARFVRRLDILRKSINIITHLGALRFR